MLQPTASLSNRKLFQQRHRILNRHLLGMYPALQRFQGLHIATHIGEVVVEMRRYRKVKVLAHKADKEKGVMYLLGSNLTYLLRLGLIPAHADLTPM